jgi:DNA-directed RNA polymerase subunit alpha
VVTAGDISPNSDIEIVNPELPLLTLTDKAASVEMTLWVKRGRGYETVESRVSEELEVNAIAIDAIYTPVRQVGYQVDNVRVGGRTDYDKVIMQIETNGAITIEEAVRDVSGILAEHFTLIAAKCGAEESAKDQDEKEDESE